MAKQIEVKIERIPPDRTRHPPLLPLYHVTMEATGPGAGVWEETCYGEDQLRLCLNFLQAGAAFAGNVHFSIPEIPR